MGKRPLIYIAGPYTNPDPVQNTHEAIRFGLQVYKDTGCPVIIPHLTMTAHLVEPHEVAFWYEFDLEQLAHCDAVFRMPGRSTGADAEVTEAQRLGIPVYEQESFLYSFCERERARREVA
jgi:nucleoside 2-deoxyribosyltransferase